MRKLILFLAAVSLVLVAEKALCRGITFSIEPESFNSFRYKEMRVEGPIELSIRTGRFLSVDPGGWDSSRPQSWNRYAYVTNNPIRKSDPNGQEEFEALTHGADTHVARRSGETGRVNGYETYDANGNPIVRFRGEGKNHGGVEPPVILEPKPNKGPGAKPIVPRKLRADELPNGYKPPE